MSRRPVASVRNRLRLGVVRLERRSRLGWFFERLPDDAEPNWLHVLLPKGQNKPQVQNAIWAGVLADVKSAVGSAKDELAEKQAELDKITRRLEDLQRQFRESVAKKEALQRQKLRNVGSQWVTSKTPFLRIAK